MMESQIVFLALCIWREARGEEFSAKLGVGWSVINRVNACKWFGKNILDVIFKSMQYSSLTDPKDKQLTKWPRQDDESWRSCIDAAKGILNGRYLSPIKDATHYHDTSVEYPNVWGPSEFVIQLGKLKFYRGIA